LVDRLIPELLESLPDAERALIQDAQKRNTKGSPTHGGAHSAQNDAPKGRASPR